jgi:hypothetical protein
MVFSSKTGRLGVGGEASERVGLRPEIQVVRIGRPAEGRTAEIAREDRDHPVRVLHGKGAEEDGVQ